ncbi:vWA domain-containing protein [Streptomyces niger]|uniref:vWA domain-containing protein n=1 Tax=Streptomyces niger TaxID=66373 RepID=UPI00069C765C|nr:VWA domain-containing protein [Streptomyces niger]
MARRRRRTAATLIGGLLLTLLTVPQASAEPSFTSAGMVMVLDSSGSMAQPDGSGHTRIAAARTAVATLADSLPDGFPTGLRVYGADKNRGCDDTRLAQPVRPLDRAGLKKAVAKVEPKGDTPIGLSLKKAAADLPQGSAGRRTIVLISDGEDTCQSPPPCEVAEELGRSGVDLRIDTIGFQVRGKARQQLECVAQAGNGRYYDAPDAKSLARQMQRAGTLSADSYHFRGKQVRGTPARSAAPAIAPGQYRDTIGPGEKRFYQVRLDYSSTADFSATAVPHPGAAVDTTTVLRTQLAYGVDSACESSTEVFGQNEGATPLTSGVSRIPSEDGNGSCDKAGRYWFVVERETADGSDAARWPLELTYRSERPLKKGVTPAQSEPEYGAGGKDAVVPSGAPKDVTGGTGFNDATKIGEGVWRDKVLPSQTLWYKVPVGWGQQLRYDVEFANEPTVRGHSAQTSYGATQVYTPARQPVGGGTGEFTPQTPYNGRQASLRMGTVPVSWTNRYESDPNVVPVHRAGDFYLAVTLGAKAAEIADNPRIGVVLRVAVLGEAESGPQAHAAVVKHPAAADSGTADGGGGTRPVIAVVGIGVGVLLLAGLAVLYLRGRGNQRRTGTGSGGAGAW